MFVFIARFRSSGKAGIVCVFICLFMHSHVYTAMHVLLFICLRLSVSFKSSWSRIELGGEEVGVAVNVCIAWYLFLIHCVRFVASCRLCNVGGPGATGEQGGCGGEG